MNAHLPYLAQSLKKRVRVNKRQRKPKGQSRMDNLEKLATLVIQLVLRDQMLEIKINVYVLKTEVGVYGV